MALRVRNGARRLFMKQGAKSRSRDRLLRLLPKDSIGAEIGVWKGDFSSRMLTQVKPREMHLIDPWTFLDEPAYERAWYGGDSARCQADMDDLHREVVDRFAAEISRGVVQIHRLTSQDAASLFRDDYFDWVYIDGNHLYEFVRRDLQMYYPKVKSSGLLAGDDYGKEGWWANGVQQAVDELVAAGRGTLQLLGSQFVIQKN